MNSKPEQRVAQVEGWLEAVGTVISQELSGERMESFEAAFEKFKGYQQENQTLRENLNKLSKLSQDYVLNSTPDDDSFSRQKEDELQSFLTSLKTEAQEKGGATSKAADALLKDMFAHLQREIERKDAALRSAGQALSHYETWPNVRAAIKKALSPATTKQEPVDGVEYLPIVRWLMENVGAEVLHYDSGYFAVLGNIEKASSPTLTGLIHDMGLGKEGK